jgi:hypothetical protein
MATPVPPPIQREAKPSLALRRRILWSKVTGIRRREDPIGWRRAMAPPFTFPFARSQPVSLCTASGEIDTDKVSAISI